MGGSGNIWGTANPTPLPGVFAPTSDIPCEAGDEQVVIPCTGLLAISPGSYYALITGVLSILMGAVAPATLTIAAKFASGADFDSFVVDPNIDVALAEFMVPFSFVSPCAPGVFVGAGAEIDVTALGDTQGVTVRQIGSRALVQLVRGPD